MTKHSQPPPWADELSREMDIECIRAVNIDWVMENWEGGAYDPLPALGISAPALIAMLIRSYGEASAVVYEAYLVQGELVEFRHLVPPLEVLNEHLRALMAVACAEGDLQSRPKRGYVEKDTLWLAILKA